jgi:hypothetical protein
LDQSIETVPIEGREELLDYLNVRVSFHEREHIRGPLPAAVEVTLG